VTPERKYRMIRLSAGDYLLPGNDGETIFRVAKYDEDGSIEGVTGEYWAVYRWPKPKNTLRERMPWGESPWDAWEEWHLIADLFSTRQDAIDAALDWEWRRDNPLHDRPERKPLDIASMYGAFSTSKADA
jgi:hypothetical protein